MGKLHRDTGQQFRSAVITGAGEPPHGRRPNRKRFKPSVEPDPPSEWDNPYLKKPLDKGTRLHLAALRKSRIEAASDPSDPVDRAAIIKRDDSRCWICRKQVSGRDLHLDHVMPLARGGKHVPANVRVACTSCNTWKGGRLVTPL